MKTKLSVLLICFFIFWNGATHLAAQVVIGLNEAPEEYSTLQIKDKIIDRTGTLDAATAERGGLLLPRVELKKKKELLPFVTQAEVDANPQSQAYLDNKKLHTGLVVYNLIESDEEELCIGINQWDGEQWNCLQNKVGNAIAELGNCDSIQFSGQYKDKVALSGGNYMTIPLHVTKAGAYTITARAAYSANHAEDNGYYFTQTGVFITPGYYFISVPGAGTPLKFTPTGNNGDPVSITFNNKTMNACDPLYIKVEDSSKKPLYVMNCSSVKVRGVYKLDVPLDPNTNFIEMTLNVDLAAVGSTYIIETNTVDGISFRDEGLLTGTTMNIKLKGSGTPNSLDNKEMIIASNSQKSVATCKATVIVVIPKKRIYTLGTSAGYGYNLAEGSVARTVLTRPSNFGVLENSVVKTDMASYDFIISNINGTPLSAQITTILNELKNNKPDIVLITQDFYIPTDSDKNRLMDGFVEYLNKKGVMLLLWEANPVGSTGSAYQFFSYLFNVSAIRQARGQGSGSIYKFTNVDDEILNGPFGDIRGKYWGEDASWAMSVKNLPLSELEVYSYGDDYSNRSGSNDITGIPVVFRHKTMNLFYAGDGGFISAPDAAINSANGYGGDKWSCPFAFDRTTNLPKVKPNYGEGVSYDVYNSVAFFNIFAWAVRKAQFDGINTVQ